MAQDTGFSFVVPLLIPDMKDSCPALPALSSGEDATL